MNLSPGERLGLVVAAVATPIVIVAVAIVVFFNAPWVYFEQGRSGADRWTGFTTQEVQQVTGAILSDLVFGPPNFDVTIDGQPVLDARERGHMVDVRNVFFEFGVVALIAVFVLVAGWLLSRRGGGGGRWFWRGVQIGSGALATAVVVVGVAFIFMFDAAFELFHSLFFPPGSFDFDPRTERLVQLFPDQFWSDTFTLAAAFILVLAIVVTLLARRLVNRPGPRRVTAPSAGPA